MDYPQAVDLIHCVADLLHYEGNPRLRKRLGFL